MLKRAFDILVKTYTAFSRDEASLLGAGISFYALFSVAPLFIFGVGIVGLVLGDEAARGLIVSQVVDYVGHDAAELIQGLIAATQTSSGGFIATIVGAVVVIYGGHNIFLQMRRALNMVHGLPPQDERPGLLRSVVIERGLSILALFALGAIFVGLAIATLLVNVVVRSFEQVAPIWRALATPIDFLVTFVVVTVVVAVMYRILPTRNLRWRRTLPGAALAGVVFFIVKYALGLYLAYASVASAYGAAGSLVALLLWVFLTSLAILFGAEFNQVLVEELNHLDRTDVYEPEPEPESAPEPSSDSESSSESEPDSAPDSESEPSSDSAPESEPDSNSATG